MCILDIAFEQLKRKCQAAQDFQSLGLTLCISHEGTVWLLGALDLGSQGSWSDSASYRMNDLFRKGRMLNMPLQKTFVWLIT